MSHNELDELWQKLTATRKRINNADEYLKTMGEGAQKVGLSIDGSMLELNILLKDLFLCSTNDLPEYEILHAELIRNLNNIHFIVNTKFGKIKADPKKLNGEAH